MAEFAQGNTYQSGTSGVGPFILARDKPKDTVDSFLTTYDTVNNWRAQKENEKLVKAKYLDQKLADLDFNSEGVPPTKPVQDWIRNQKSKTIGVATKINMLTEGGDLNDPKWREEHDIVNREMKISQGVVDGLVSANTIATAWRDDYTENIDKYDPTEIEAMERALAKAPPVSTNGEKSYGELVSELPKPRQKTLVDVAGDVIKADVGKKVTTVTDPKTGEVREETSYDFDELLPALYNNEPAVKDQVNERLEALIVGEQEGDPVAKGVYDAYKDRALKQNKSVEEVATIDMMKPLFPQKNQHKGFTPESRERWQWKYSKGGEEQDAMAADINHWFQMMSGVAGYYDDNGDFNMDVQIARPLGDFTHEVKEFNMMSGQTETVRTEIRKNLLEAGKIVVDDNSNKVFLIKTTQSDLENENEEDKWIRTDDPYRVLGIPAAAYGKDRGMFFEMSEEMGNDFGVYDNHTWNKDGFSPSLYPDQKKPLNKDKISQDYKNPTYTANPQATPSMIKMTIEQRQRYVAFKKANSGMEPNKQQLDALMEGKQPPSAKTINRSDISAKAKAAGYSTAEYEKLLKQKGVEIVE